MLTLALSENTKKWLKMEGLPMPLPSENEDTDEYQIFAPQPSIVLCSATAIGCDGMHLATALMPETKATFQTEWNCQRVFNMVGPLPPFFVIGARDQRLAEFACVEEAELPMDPMHPQKQQNDIRIRPTHASEATFGEVSNPILLAPLIDHLIEPYVESPQDLADGLAYCMTASGMERGDMEHILQALNEAGEQILGSEIVVAVDFNREAPPPLDLQAIIGKWLFEIVVEVFERLASGQDCLDVLLEAKIAFMA